MLFLLLSLPFAHAGKLAEGFRGVPFGDASPLLTPPLPDCTKSPEDGVLWRCATKLGEFPVTVSYMVELNTFTGVFLLGSGYTNCAGLYDTLKAGWGTGTPQREYDTSALPDWKWRDGSAFGTFEYNRFSYTCTALAAHMGYYAEVKEKKEKEAAKGAGDL